MIDDPFWVEDAGWFAAHPNRKHYARLMPDGSTCVVRLDSAHLRGHPVFLRTYGLMLFQDPEPQTEEECEEAWLRLARWRSIAAESG